MRQPTILILDEVTSHLDAESEAAIQQALERAMEGRTVLIIAHRPSTVKNADRILVLQEGRIVEEGTREQLLAQSTLYRRFTRCPSSFQKAPLPPTFQTVFSRCGQDTTFRQSLFRQYPFKVFGFFQATVGYYGEDTTLKVPKKRQFLTKTAGGLG